MNLRQFEQVVWHRLRPPPCPCEAGDHGSGIVSSVEAILDFGEVTRHVLFTDSVVGTGDRPLDVAKSCVDPLECRSARRRRFAPCDDDLMRTSYLGDATEAAQAIADHRTVRCEAGLGKGGNWSGCRNSSHTGAWDELAGSVAIFASWPPRIGWEGAVLRREDGD